MEEKTTGGASLEGLEGKEPFGKCEAQGKEQGSGGSRKGKGDLKGIKWLGEGSVGKEWWHQAKEERMEEDDKGTSVAPT